MKCCCEVYKDGLCMKCVNEARWKHPLWEPMCEEHYRLHLPLTQPDHWKKLPCT